MLAIYILTLFISSGMTGVYVRHALAEQGFVTGFSGGALLTIGVACAFASLQLGYVAVLRLFWPPKTNAPLLGECISQLGCLLLTPYLMDMQINWPHPVLKEIEPLIFLGAFAVFHAAFKVLTLFSFLRSLPGSRLTAVVWAAAAGITLLAGYTLSHSWIGRVERAQTTVLEDAEPYRVSGAFAMARALPESCDYTVPLSPGADSVLVLRWANLPEASADDRMGRIHVTVDFECESGKSYDTWIDVSPSQWLEMHVPAEIVPDDATACTVMWGIQKPPKWRTLTRLRPSVQSERRVLLSGPVLYAAQSAKAPPSIVLVAIDGLGAYHFTGLGTSKAYTPAMSRFAKGSLVYLQAYTTAPESAAAAMSLLTGVGPLRHGYLGMRTGPTPQSISTLAESLREAGYATAAFSEGDRFNDLESATSFARGFDVVDVSAHLEDSDSLNTSVVAAPATVETHGGEEQSVPASSLVFGSAQTLNLASAWIKASHGVRFFTFIRLTDLREPGARSAFGLDDSANTLQAKYDSALLSLDRAMGQFLATARDSAGGANTVIVVVGTYGTDFATAGAASATSLTEPALRVPLILCGPGVEPGTRKDLVSLEGVAPTLASLCGVSLGSAVAPRNLLGDAIAEEPVSVAGDPLTITSRNDSWRIFWETGRTPFKRDSAGPQGYARLYNLTRYTPRAGLADQAPRNTNLVAQWVTVLQRYLEVQSTEWP